MEAAREVEEGLEALGVLAVEVVVEAAGMVEKIVEATGTEEMMGATVGAMVVTKGSRALKELRIHKAGRL